MSFNQKKKTRCTRQHACSWRSTRSCSCCAVSFRTPMSLRPLSSPHGCVVNCVVKCAAKCDTQKVNCDTQVPLTHAPPRPPLHTHTPPPHTRSPPPLPLSQILLRNIWYPMLLCYFTHAHTQTHTHLQILLRNIWYPMLLFYFTLCFAPQTVVVPKP